MSQQRRPVTLWRLQARQLKLPRRSRLQLRVSCLLWLQHRRPTTAIVISSYRALISNTGMPQMSLVSLLLR